MGNYYCGNCGANVSEDASYCRACRMPLSGLREGSEEFKFQLRQQHARRRRERRVAAWELFKSNLRWFVIDHGRALAVAATALALLCVLLLLRYPLGRFLYSLGYPLTTGCLFAVWPALFLIFAAFGIAFTTGGHTSTRDRLRYAIAHILLIRVWKRGEAWRTLIVWSIVVAVSVVTYAFVALLTYASAEGLEEQPIWTTAARLYAWLIASLLGAKHETRYRRVKWGWSIEYGAVRYWGLAIYIVLVAALGFGLYSV